MTDVMGMCIIEPISNHFRKLVRSSLNNIVDVVTYTLFDIIVARIGYSDVLLPKEIVLDHTNLSHGILIRNVNFCTQRRGLHKV